MKIDIVTIFPRFFDSPLQTSIVHRAITGGHIDIHVHDLRQFATDRHKTVDAAPFGGGPGMVMRADVIDAALKSVAPKTRPIYLTPRGRPIDQICVKALAAQPEITVLCGRFEGVDERVLEEHECEQLSVGDFVLSGGEPAAIALIDACVRLLPGVIGAAESLAEESFEGDLLEYPHYTRPEQWRGRAVPELLLSGHHERIKNWRRESAERTTRERRPDLWARHQNHTLAVKD